MSADSGIDTGEIRRHLAPIVSMLNADGYDLAVTAQASTLEVAIVASPNACPDCLVPPEVMTSIVRDRLTRVLGDARVPELTVKYPSGDGH